MNKQRWKWEDWLLCTVHTYYEVCVYVHVYDSSVLTVHTWLAVTYRKWSWFKMRRTQHWNFSSMCKNLPHKHSKYAAVICQVFFHSQQHFSGLNSLSRAVLQLQNSSLGAPTTTVKEIIINTAAIIVWEYYSITVAGMADMLYISSNSVFTILHDHLNVRCICAEWVPRFLIPVQKLMWVKVYYELQHLVVEHGEAYFNSIISSDESWLHHYYPKSKQTSKVWKTSSSPKPKLFGQWEE